MRRLVIAAVTILIAILPSVAAVAQTVENGAQDPVRSSSGVGRPVSSGDATKKKEYWIDDRTKLMWTVKGNGQPLAGPQAIEWCKALGIGSFNDWRQPSIDELSGIFDPSTTTNGPKIKSPIKLTCRECWKVWSGTAGPSGNATPSAWLLDFYSGRRFELFVSKFVTGGAALCVRRSSDE